MNRRAAQARHQAARSEARRRRALDALALAVVVAGWTWLLLPARAARPARGVSLPELTVRTDSAGVRCAAVDMNALRAAFTAAGLSDPPDLDRSDPVPVTRLLGFARDWIESGRVSALGAMGQVYQAIAAHEPALECFVAAAAIDPDDVRWRYALGVECQALGLQEQAIESLKRAAEMDPAYPTTWARLGALYLERSELDAARESYDRCRMLLPDESLAYVGLGRVALARGDSALAQEHLRSAIARSPDDFLAHRLLGAAYAAAGLGDLARDEQRISERLPQYSGWLTFDPRLREAHALAGTQHNLSNQMRLVAGDRDFQAISRIAQELLERRPDDYSTLGNLAAAYLEMGRADLADAAINRALALKPDSARLLLVQAAIAFEREDLAAVHRSLDAAAGLDPANPKLHELRGRAYLLQGRLADGIQSLDRAVALDPDSIDARLVLAFAYRSTGRTADAAHQLDLVLRLDPGNHQARQMLQSLPQEPQGR